MRRSDKEITDKSILESIINSAQVCRIGLVDNDFPYVIPMSFGYKDDCLYLHSALEGKKIDLIQQNNNVCFEIDIDYEMVTADVPCRFTAKYRSVIGFGRAYFLETVVEKVDAFTVMVEHYGGKVSSAFALDGLQKVAVIKVEIDSMTGKQSGY